ncbi:ComF family protein [Hoyosella altamirensis]|uniref:Putative amidophosphoribosyltransferase n=1 Tax=Hoyosella altamirensis TaxID=616997 RepID=A0A839RHN6_9ACTN|nr:ComF family protein [Hoyosella altamirensis]MBB3035643.1 putative amidophosphoribosyltransferase [Hoyosella altamirensis]
MRALLDLVLPAECGGCSAPGLVWCGQCAEVAFGSPRLCNPRSDPGVPVWALTRYRGAARELIVNLKERGRSDLAAVAGAAVVSGIETLRQEGELDPAQLAHLLLVPAPSRWLAARRRGGDPIASIAAHAIRTLPDEAASVVKALRFTRGVKDSVGLTASQRHLNVAGRVRMRQRFASQLLPSLSRPASAVLLLDDVVTTGSLLTESVRILHCAGVRVSGALTLASA